MKGTFLESPDKSKLFLCAVGTIPEQLGHCCCHLQNQEPRSRSSSGGTFSGSPARSQGYRTSVLPCSLQFQVLCLQYEQKEQRRLEFVMKKEQSIQPFPTTMCSTFKRTRIDNNRYSEF